MRNEKILERNVKSSMKHMIDEQQIILIAIFFVSVVLSKWTYITLKINYVMFFFDANSYKWLTLTVFICTYT